MPKIHSDSIRIRKIQSIQLLKWHEQGLINQLHEGASHLFRQFSFYTCLEYFFEPWSNPSNSTVGAAEDMRFADTLNKVFSKNLLAIPTGKDAILKEVRDCVLRNDAYRLKEISPYIFSYWRDLSVKHRCLCWRIAIPKAIKDAVLEDIHSTHPGNFAMMFLAENVWWPYIHRDILA